MDTVLLRDQVTTNLCHYHPELCGKIVRFKKDEAYQPETRWYERYADIRMGCYMCENGLAASMPMNIHRIKDTDEYFKCDQVDIDYKDLEYHYDINFNEYHITKDKDTIAKLQTYKKLYGNKLEASYYFNDNDDNNRYLGESHQGIYQDDTSEEQILCTRCYKWFLICNELSTNESLSKNFQLHHPIQQFWDFWLDDFNNDFEWKN